MQAREVATRGQNTTLEIAMLEAVVDLDSAQTDAVESLGEGSGIEYSDDGNVRPGQLQRLEQLETTFFGDSSGSEGLISQMRKMDDPGAGAEG